MSLLQCGCLQTFVHPCTSCQSFFLSLSPSNLLQLGKLSRQTEGWLMIYLATYRPYLCSIACHMPVPLPILGPRRLLPTQSIFFWPTPTPTNVTILINKPLLSTLQSTSLKHYTYKNVSETASSLSYVSSRAGLIHLMLTNLLGTVKEWLGRAMNISKPASMLKTVNGRSDIYFEMCRRLICKCLLRRRNDPMLIIE